jgi:preprotein translocase subunit SecE
MSKLTDYIRDTKAEMKHMSWPTRSQAVNSTLLVIGVSIIVALILSICDLVFGLGLEKLIQR